MWVFPQSKWVMCPNSRRTSETCFGQNMFNLTFAFLRYFSWPSRLTPMSFQTCKCHDLYYTLTLPLVFFILKPQLLKHPTKTPRSSLVTTTWRVVSCYPRKRSPRCPEHQRVSTDKPLQRRFGSQDVRWSGWMILIGFMKMGTVDVPTWMLLMFMVNIVTV